MAKPIRILLKLSGEALSGDKHFGLDFNTIEQICKAIKQVNDEGVQVAIVVGGGNFWRGVKDGGGIIERCDADHMGMLATTMNALAVADTLKKLGVDARVQTAVQMLDIAEYYTSSKAIAHLEKNRVVVLACGTGSPYFTTDTGAALRAVEIKADVILLAKNVDGVYDSDPVKNPNAKKYDRITYKEVLEQNLAVMDSTANSLAMDNHIPIHVFGLKEPESIIRALHGEKIGTIVKESF